MQALLSAYITLIINFVMSIATRTYTWLCVGIYTLLAYDFMFVFCNILAGYFTHNNVYQVLQ